MTENYAFSFYCYEELNRDIRKNKTIPLRVLTLNLSNTQSFKILGSTFQCTLSPSSIHIYFIGHIWEHEFCHLGCWAVKEKFLKRRNICLRKQLFELVFSCFEGQKFNFFLCVRTKKLLNKKFEKI